MKVEVSIEYFNEDLQHRLDARKIGGWELVNIAPTIQYKNAHYFYWKKDE